MKKSVGFLSVLFVIIVIVNAWSIVSLFDQYSIYNEASQNNILSVETVEESNVQMQLLTITQMILYILIFITFCLWFYGVHEDLESLGAKDLKYSHGQTFWGFIIPIVNIVRPYRIAKEVWTQSSKDSAKKSFVVLFWWLSVLLTIVLGYVSGLLVAFSDDVETFKNSILALIAADALGVFAAMFAFSMVRSIEKLQKESYATN
ncbi:DUF4328 domain-containing protein [Candidatus Uabimicrobium amorphum]|uniref:DUF4328 domain-containing protein n=1 Tax=Uabimicrobium amorphum TaxID=2596890 RepID=A0A5S9IIS8_UABAM|nr:DUF4328 domain-containing protein [Candidatus Uabimicrobium amorphum]BBM82639.1 hypothetical protein UABAM_00982 [Candidatus Uabimicrobium amorphum]